MTWEEYAKKLDEYEAVKDKENRHMCVHITNYA
jgi:hypothetical protein